MDTVENIVIVGAGFAGLATALGLHRKGVKSLVLESSPTMRATGFAFTIWTNAWRALDALGVGDKVRDHHLLLESVTFLSATSGDISAKVNLDKAQGKIGVKIQVLIGCDGINSVVAKYLGLEKPLLSGRCATRGISEHPSGHGFKHDFLNINGGGFRSGFLPCSEKTIYWYFTWCPSENGAEKVDESIQKMREFVVKTFTASKVPREMIEVIERSEMSEVVSSPLRYRSPVSLLFGNIIKRNICVIGDALHPMTPDLGQGACTSLEDGVILSRYLADAVHDGNVEVGLEKFTRERRWRCANVVAKSYITGFIQQSSNWFVSFLREKLLAGIMARDLVNVSDYDCGKL
ncbi:zeaxanthin epoxidase [Carex littledalei]|uniref:Zeaxanthin epoxidase n=1 Tax=Carex littledalei TaxID=544730 RepID=A0A833QT97_9POAL|nr:zeaxanthin epoxidase [Carex littledalei]